MVSSSPQYGRLPRSCAHRAAGADVMSPAVDYRTNVALSSVTRGYLALRQHALTIVSIPLICFVAVRPCAPQRAIWQRTLRNLAGALVSCSATAFVPCGRCTLVDWQTPDVMSTLLRGYPDPAQASRHCGGPRGRQSMRQWLTLQLADASDIRRRIEVHNASDAHTACR